MYGHRTCGNLYQSLKVFGNDVCLKNKMETFL